LFLAVATTETSVELQGVIDALAADRVLVVCVYAPPEVVASRIADREPDTWPGKEPLIAHARNLARSIPALAGIDVVVSTDGRSAVEVAAEVYRLLCDRQFIPG
jgi:chloramphenicol 3-O-phosphotransferase